MAMKGSQPTGMATAIRETLEKARLEAWGDLIPKLGAIYGPKPARADLAAPQIATGDPSKPNTFAIVNTGGKLLTDVTLVVDQVSFTDAPYVTNRHVLFVRQWAANQPVYLNIFVAPSMITDKARWNAYPAANQVADKSRWRPRDAELRFDLAHNDRALIGLGGIVEARVTVWAAEAHQPQRVVKYPDVVLAAARFELDALHRVTEREILQALVKAQSDTMNLKAQQALPVYAGDGRLFRLKPPHLVPPEFKALGPGSWILRAGPRVAELARGTALEQEAQALLADPVDSIRQRRQKQFDWLTQASAAKQQWSGTWAFQTIPSPIADVLKTRVGSTGRIALTFEAPPPPTPPTPPFKADPKALRVAARFFNPESPDSYRFLIGEIITGEGGHLCDGSMHSMVLRMGTALDPSAAKQKKAPPRPKPNFPDRQTLEHDEFTIELTGDDSGLKGFALTKGQIGNQRRDYQFEVVLKSEAK